jgi:polysaccharide export outer membrane protein
MKQYIYLLVAFFFFAACSNPRRYTYFKDVSDTTSYYSIPDTGYKELVIRPDDMLMINVSSPNAEATSFFVVPGGNTSTSNSTAAVNGLGTNISQTPAQGTAPNTYLVNKEGAIDLPLVGRLVVKGLTTTQAKELVRQNVAVYLKNPIVSVRLQNFKVTVLGEVTRPANYIVPNERISVLDAIGMAGDLTIFGKRDNVLLIREREGRKVLTRLNLNSSDLFKSPYYYLQQNDILYIEPNKSKAATTDMAQIRNVSIFTSLAALATIIISRL